MRCYKKFAKYVARDIVGDAKNNMQTQPIQLLRKAVIDTITAKEIRYLTLLRLIKTYLDQGEIERAQEMISEELINE